MNISKYIIYYPYLTAWFTSKLFRKKKVIDFYCGNIVDYICFKKVLAHYPEMRVIAKNRNVQKNLAEYGVKAKLYPSYPDIVVMCRHSARKYPGSGIIKIGLRHGPYHFKDFINSRYYNEFNNYLFTSEYENEIATRKGINNGIGVGYPKIDDAFDGSIRKDDLDNLRRKINIDNSKATIIFTATWNKTTYSAVNLWYNRLDELKDKYNILVTVHDWTTSDVVARIKETKGIYFINDKEVLPYLMIADLLIGDISSIIAEFCALDKAIITFRVKEGKRISQEITQMLEEMTYRIDSFEELSSTIEEALQDNGQKHRPARRRNNDKFFGKLDGKAHERVKKIIDRYLESE